MTDWDDLMDFAARKAEGAGEVTLKHFGHAAVDFKGDGSEVTAADLAAEAYVRAALAEAFPEDGILGEEGEDREARSARRGSGDPSRGRGRRGAGRGVPGGRHPRRGGGGPRVAQRAAVDRGPDRRDALLRLRGAAVLGAAGAGDRRRGLAGLHPPPGALADAGGGARSGRGGRRPPGAA